MIKSKLLTVLLFIIAVSLLTGCEKLTASLDGVNKESPGTAPEVVPPTTPQPQSQPPTTESSSPTGGIVIEPKPQPQAATHIVKMTADGFSPDKIYIKVGDTVEWKNTRSGTINKAMIIGVRECREVRSGFFKPGESFTWTFDKPVTCTIADGVMTTKESKVFVE
ncbi:MAG TPA: hypothetical protein VJB13_03155 [Candidatus Nanoarchaeia archaeon]|nr:hypothetical protein [Candidatus Nanoarchaeia archaeon]